MEAQSPAGAAPGTAGDEEGSEEHAAPGTQAAGPVVDEASALDATANEGAEERVGMGSGSGLGTPPLAAAESAEHAPGASAAAAGAASSAAAATAAEESSAAAAAAAAAASTAAAAAAAVAEAEAEAGLRNVEGQQGEQQEVELLLRLREEAAEEEARQVGQGAHVA